MKRIPSHCLTLLAAMPTLLDEILPSPSPPLRVEEILPDEMLRILRNVVSSPCSCSVPAGPRFNCCQLLPHRLIDSLLPSFSSVIPSRFIFPLSLSWFWPPTSLFSEGRTLAADILLVVLRSFSSDAEILDSLTNMLDRDEDLPFSDLSKSPSFTFSLEVDLLLLPPRV